MSSNIRTSLKTHESAVAYKDRLINGKENTRLIRAPAIESKIVWKAHSLRFAYNILRIKLDSQYTVESLISVFRSYFPLGIQQSENEACTAVENLRSSFGNVAYLVPL